MATEFTSGRSLRGLFVAATDKEATALAEGCGAQFEPGRTWQAQPLLPWADIVECGVGKAAAAGATVRCVGQARLVICVGIAGVLENESFRPGEIVLGSQSVMADEGVLTPDGFHSITSLGFVVPGNDGHGISPSGPTLQQLGGLADRTAIIATVSCCSGSDEQARSIRDRTGAYCEAMEGAGAGLAAARLGLDFAEFRSISNTTGNRSEQRWDIGTALRGLTRLGERLAMLRSS